MQNRSLFILALLALALTLTGYSAFASNASATDNNSASGIYLTNNLDHDRDDVRRHKQFHRREERQHERFHDRQERLKDRDDGIILDFDADGDADIQIK